MTITNKLGLPEGFVRACETTAHNRPGHVSATTLLKGTKEIVLTQRHWDELEDDVADRVWAIWGSGCIRSFHVCSTERRIIAVIAMLRYLMFHFLRHL